MGWDIGRTQDFDDWFRDLDDPEQEAIVVAVDRLKELGDDIDAAAFVSHTHGSPRDNLRAPHTNGNGLEVSFTYDRRASTIALHAGEDRV